jgi:hypothetical protein
MVWRLHPQAESAASIRSIASWNWQDLIENSLLLLSSLWQAHDAVVVIDGAVEQFAVCKVEHLGDADRRQYGDVVGGTVLDPADVGAVETSGLGRVVLRLPAVLLARSKLAP